MQNTSDVCAKRDSMMTVCQRVCSTDFELECDTDSLSTFSYSPIWWAELVLPDYTARVSTLYSAPHFKGHFRDIAQASVCPPFSLTNTDFSLLMIHWLHFIHSQSKKTELYSSNICVFWRNDEGLSNETWLQERDSYWTVFLIKDIL